MKKKSRIQWLQQGDSNTAYFHDVMKDRCNNKRMERLVDDQGNECITKEDIENEVLQFYMSLLGISKGNLRGVDVRIIRQERVLSVKQRKELCRAVKSEEIDAAL